MAGRIPDSFLDDLVVRSDIVEVIGARVPLKKAGRDTKAEVKRDASKTHNALTDAGNDTKTALKKTTGIKGSQSHQPGGLNKMAPLLADADTRAQLLALRLAVLFHHARGPIDPPRIVLTIAAAIRLNVAARWLKLHPVRSRRRSHQLI